MNKPDPWAPVREPALRVEGLVKGYGRRRVIDGFDLRVEAGRIVLLAGVNGAGKSTALRASLGLARPERGSCAFWGRPLRTLEPAARWVGVAFATPRHHPGRTVLAEARLAATAGGLSRAAAARGGPGRLVRRSRRLRGSPLTRHAPATRARQSHWSATPRCCSSTSSSAASTPPASIG